MTEPIREWPVLCRYDVAHSQRVALPVGGIGTGTVSVGGRGDVRDWEVVNRPAKGWGPPRSFFAVRTAVSGDSAEDAVTARALEGPLDLFLYEGAHGSGAANHGLPRFARSEFLAAYPFGQVVLEDSDVPVGVRLQVFNPFIPPDADDSGIPVAILRYVVTNSSTETVDVSVAGSLQNFVGTDGFDGEPRRNRNRRRQESGCTGVYCDSEGVDPAAEQWGSLALVALDEDEVSVRTAWADHSWGGDLLDFWDDFVDNGHVDERESSADAPVGSVVAKRTLAPGTTHAFTFLLGWCFPNRRDWFRESTVGNYYATRHRDAWHVVTDTAQRLPDLERRTIDFVEALLSSDVADVIKEAALFNLSTLRTQTCFRTRDGLFWGWEGCNDSSGCCSGSCTHVWNYEQATPYLFAPLARLLREVEFGHATDDNGLMSFRIQLPLERAQSHGRAAADGQMGCLVKLYREWRTSGDDEWLARLWPKAKKALEFAWIEGGWDADRDGVMEGTQHNTMDVEYFGPNPEIGAWYLAALRAAEEMARHLGDTDFADTCADLFRRGSAWLDENLFNGEYYEHHIRPPSEESAIAEGLRVPGIGARDLTDPELQIGAGCLTDQLIGQNLAHLTGLGYLLEPAHVRTTLSSITRYNRMDDLAGHFNPMRSYALGDDKGLVVASYPHGNRPTRPFPYFDEIWGGLEYTAAIGMIYEGLEDEAIRVVTDTRDRYDGRRRNPFDEAECGHHYVRCMASWGTIPALAGFHYDALTQALRFNAATRPTRWFWASGDAWGTIDQTPQEGHIDVALTIHAGTLTVRQLTLTGAGAINLDTPRTLVDGSSMELSVIRD